MTTTDIKIINELKKQIESKNDFLDFKAENTNYATHNYHDYPATMIPQLPKLFIESVKKFQNISSIYDPFAGSGTTLVESRLHGIDSVGVDLNPLAILMADVKTTLINHQLLEKEKTNLYLNIQKEKSLFFRGKK